MSDGRIVIDVDVDDTGAERGLGGIEQKIKGIGDTSTKASGGVKDIATSLGLVKLASSAIDVLRKSLDGAITRFDTLNQFPKMMEAIGFTSDESSKAIQRLSEGIQGLPTRLDEVVSTAQRMGAMTKDLNLATDLTLSLNNAFLASGASAGDASRGLEQYLQMMSTGKVDMQSWRTLLETMNIALGDVAESFGLSTNQLYDALQNGDITFDQFNRRIIEMNDGVDGFAERALIGSEGIRTSFANIATAVVNGVEKSIRATDELVEDLTGKNIAQHFDGLKGVVNDAFGAITAVIGASKPVISGAITVFDLLFGVIKSLDWLIVGFIGTWGGLKVIAITTTLIGKAVTAYNLLHTAIQLSAIRAGNLSVMTQVLTASQIANVSAVKLMDIAIAMLTGKITLAQGATILFNKALTFLGGPIGLVALAIGAIAAGGYALYKAFGQATPEVQALTAEMEDANQATIDLQDSIENNAKSFEKQMDSIDAQAEAMRSLVDDTVALSKQEQLSAGDKKLLQANIDSLNESLGGLGLAYDEQTNSLTHTAEAMQGYIDLMKEEEKLAVSTNRVKQLEIEGQEIANQIEINKRLIDDAQTELDGTNWLFRNSGSIDEMNELKSNTEELIRVQGLLAEESEVASQIQVESAQRASEAQRLMVEQGITSLAQLTDAQRELVENTKEAYGDFAETATSVFDDVATESKASIEQMIETSRKNNEAMLQMAEEASTLRDRFNELGLDQSIIDQFINMGTEGPALVSELTSATDEQLKTLVSNTDTTSTEFKDAFMKMFDIDEAEFADGFMGLVTTMESSLAEQLASSDLKKTIADELTSDTTAVTEAGQDIGKAVASGVGASAPELKTAGGQASQSVADGITEQATVAVTAMETVMTDLATTTTTGATESQTAMETGMLAIASVVETGYASVVSSITQAYAQIVASTSSTASSVVSSLRGAIGGARQAGVDTGAGFRVGLEGQRGSIMATARSIASDAVSAMRAELKTSSPSKVTTEVGEDTGEGVVVGLENKFKRVQETARALASFAVPNIQGASYMQSTRNQTTNIYNETQSNPDATNAFAGVTFKVTLNDNIVGVLTPQINKNLGYQMHLEDRGW